MLYNYIKIAFRSVAANKIYAAINIAGLATGLCSCLAIGLYVFDELSYDRFHAHFDTIYRLTEKQQHSDGNYTVAVTPGPLAPTLTKDFAEILATTRVGLWGGTLAYGQQAAEAQSMLIADPSFFQVFDFPLAAGSIFKGINEVLITESMAAHLFGPDWKRHAIVGKTIALNNQQPLKLAGVLKNPPVHSHLQFDVMLPFSYLASTDPWVYKWNSNNFHTYVRVRPETDMTAFTAKIHGHLARYSDDKTTALVLQPLSDIYLKSKFDLKTDWGKRGEILYVRIFIAVALIILLIAIVNFVNLATARASKRAKEVGVRKTVGAKKSNLVIQFLSESFLTTIFAVAAALVLTQALLPLFNSLSGKQLDIPYGAFPFWLVVAGLTIAVTFFTGLYPAFFLSAFRPVRVLNGTFDVSSGKTFRQSLVVAQFAVSVTLGIATLVIYQQLRFVQSRKLGFDQSSLMFIPLKGNLKQKAFSFKEDVSRLAGVEAASAATSNLVDVSNSSQIEWEGQSPKDQFLITQMNVDADFLKTTGMSLAAGRAFSTRVPSDTSASDGNYMINETAAKRMGWTPETALGKSIKFWGSQGKIIGVIKDFHFRPLQVAIEPFVFRFRPTEFYFTMLVKTKPSLLNSTTGSIAKLYKKYDPGSPLSYGFVDQELKALYKTEQRTGEIVLDFSILAIFLSCLGLFGLATFTAEHRTKEIGIRKVLGASVAGVVSLLSKDFVKLMIISIIVASPFAGWLMTYWLQSFAYKIQLQAWMFASAGLLAMLVGLATVSYQSLKAALSNPVESLRNE